ncbi:MAG: hypothetical protein ACYTHM_20910 [Planctomycetota bacterium]|jgi:hypothetical protein
MPSKSDIQFGKIVVANHLATKEEVESSIKAQAHFERERHTIILEAILLHNDYLTIEQIEAIQKKMKRRVIFCSKCHGKFNVFQFRGSERFLCHKCGNRVVVPDREQYRQSLKDLSKKVEGFEQGEPENSEPDSEPPERETIMIRKEDIENAKDRIGGPDDSEEDVLEPVEEVEGAIEEVELEGEIELEEPVEAPPEEEVLIAEEIPLDEGSPQTPLKAEPVESPPPKPRAKEPTRGRKIRKAKPLKKKEKPGEGEKPKAPKGKLKKRSEAREGKSKLRRRR